MTKTNGHANGANGADTHSTTHQYITSTSFDLPPPPFKSHSPLKASNLFFSPLPPSKDETTPHAHGRYMLTVPWSRHSGWGQPKIGPRGEISVDPLAGSVQYAVSCFEGMKCYKGDDGKLRLFRPNKNCERLKKSAWRLGLPYDFENDELIDLFAKLVALEEPIVPSYDGGNLYMRPTLIEMSQGWGLKEDPYATEALLFVVTGLNLGTKIFPSSESPENGLRLDACSKFIRAWPGGTGSFKLGANYGPVGVAKKAGYNMSLWLHGDEDFVSEAGGMNVFILKEAPDGFLEFVTMSLGNGIVLPGVTRDSLIELINSHASGKKAFPLDGMPTKIRVVERDIAMAEIVEGAADGTLKGMFGCGTGVTVVSIREVGYKDTDIKIPYNPLVRLLRDAITGIHRGTIKHDWSFEVPVWSGVEAGKEEMKDEEVIAA